MGGEAFSITIRVPYLENSCGRFADDCDSTGVDEGDEGNNVESRCDGEKQEEKEEELVEKEDDDKVNKEGDEHRDAFATFSAGPPPGCPGLFSGRVGVRRYMLVAASSATLPLNVNEA